MNQLVTDPTTGRRYLIAVEVDRTVNGGRQVTGRVIRPRRYRGQVVTAMVSAADRLDAAEVS